jgi:hypothetical protein
VLGARERRGILLDCENLVPAAAQGKGDGVATCAGEGVNQSALRAGCDFC